MEARLYQSRQEKALERALSRPDTAAASRAGSRGAAEAEVGFGLGGSLDPSLVGRLEVPRLGLSVIVREGDDARTLKVAAGHVPGTALPWQPGNVGIAGHRDTFFRPLRGIRKGDELEVTTPKGRFRYVVDHLYIVGPRDIKVLDPSRGPRLTLVTCYPFSWAGPAPQRFIVSARKL